MTIAKDISKSISKSISSIPATTMMPKTGLRKKIPTKSRHQDFIRMNVVVLASERIADERNGVSSLKFQSNINKLKLSNARVFQIFNIPKSTAAHKISSGGKFVGTDALAAIRLEKLLLLSERIVADSLHPDAKGFDAGKWLGEWIERPQRAFGGMKPSELLDTEEGSQYVIRLLGALESGSYQ